MERLNFMLLFKLTIRQLKRNANKSPMKLKFLQAPKFSFMILYFTDTKPTTEIYKYIIQKPSTNDTINQQVDNLKQAKV